MRRRRGRPRAPGAVRTARRLRRRLRAGRAGAGAGRRHPARSDAQPPPGGADRPGHPHPRAHPQGPGARRVRPLRRHPDRRPRRRRAGAAPGTHPRRGRHGLGAGPDPGRRNRPARPRAHRCPRCLHVGQPNGCDAGLQPAASAAAAVTAHQLHPAQRTEEARQGAGAAADDHRADRHGWRDVRLHQEPVLADVHGAVAGHGPRQLQHRAPAEQEALRARVHRVLPAHRADPGRGPRRARAGAYGAGGRTSPTPPRC